MCVCVYAGTHVEARGQPWVSSPGALHLVVLRQSVCHLTWCSPIWLDWLAYNPRPEIYLTLPPQPWDSIIMPGFLTEHWGLNSCIYAHKKGISASESSLQPTIGFLNLYSRLTFQGHNEFFTKVPKNLSKIRVTHAQLQSECCSSNPPQGPFRGPAPSS